MYRYLDTEIRYDIILNYVTLSIGIVGQGEQTVVNSGRIFGDHSMFLTADTLQSLIDNNKGIKCICLHTDIVDNSLNILSEICIANDILLGFAVTNFETFKEKIDLDTINFIKCDTVYWIEPYFDYEDNKLKYKFEII
jgi:hypothetical protein